MNKALTLILLALLSLTPAFSKDKCADATFQQGKVTAVDTKEITRGGSGAWNVHNVPVYTITTANATYTVERGGHVYEKRPSLHVGEMVGWFFDGVHICISLDGKAQSFNIISEREP